MLGILFAMSMTTVQEIKVSDKEQTRVIQTNREEIVRLQSDTAYIKSGVDEIKQMLRNKN